MMRAREIHMGRLALLLLGLSGWPVDGRQMSSSAAAGIPFESADASGDGHAFLVSWLR
jgi:hypothetical protein